MDNDTASTHARSILIVDDDVFLLDMYAMRFTEDQWSVHTAINATEALKELRAGFVPDVALLDVVMPEIDGFELLATITKENLIPKSAKIFLSNLGLDEDLARAAALGADSYIIKASATPSEVVATVHEVLNKKKQS